MAQIALKDYKCFFGAGTVQPCLYELAPRALVFWGLAP